MKKSLLKQKKQGFTLMELLIVVAIIGVLAAMVLPRFTDASNKAKSSVERANVRNIDTQIELYQVNTGYYPSFPRMENMMFSASYFPDGLPKDPFTNNTAIGTYSLDMTSMDGTGSAVSLRMRTNTFQHLSVGAIGHSGYMP